MSIEMIDVLDENGVKTGEIVPRDVVHKKGLWHRCIAVAILNENDEILIQQRSKNKEKNANLWDISVAGHISASQDSVSAAIREISEEVSINLDYNINIKDFCYMFSYRTQEIISENYIDNQFSDFFILRKDGIRIEDIKMQKSEVQAVKFVTISELLDMYDKKLIVDRKPVYDELINYLDAKKA